METYNTLFGVKSAEKIESPMAAFNNFIINMGKELSTIFCVDIFGTNNCLLEDESILLFNFIKLMRVDNEMGIKILVPIINENEITFKRAFAYRKDLESIFFRYLFILNDVRHNYDGSVNSKYVESIVEDIEKNFNFNNVYLVPFKNKIFRNYDGTERSFIDKDLDKLFSRYTYVITFSSNGVKQYNWKLIRLLSSELNESYSIENIRLLDKETIKEGLLSKENLHQFLVKLMYYGEF